MSRFRVLALCAAAFVLAATVGARAAPHNVTAHSDRYQSQVRFSNKLASGGGWSLVANGSVLFADVTGGATTAYHALSDSVNTLTLRPSDKDTTVAQLNYRFLSGSYYTVSAMVGNGERPILVVLRDRPPTDSVP